MVRDYPGFLGALFIILVRIAIGWHFLHEGLEKFDSTRSGKEPFSAEIYLRNATGPLATYFRGMVPDVDGLDLLDPARLRAAWQEEVGRIEGHYGFTREQQLKAERLRSANNRWADHWFGNPENAERRRKYEHDLGQVRQIERDPYALAYQVERARDARRDLDANRRLLTGPLIERGAVLRDSVVKLATAEQIETAGAIGRPLTGLDRLNSATIYGLIAIGFCLIVGLLTPLAAVSAAIFLALIYLSMPPWPGLPPNPRAEGHYWIVSKNLIELLACLVIATTPSGHWIGLDAFFFGWRRRRRQAGFVQDRADGTSERDRRPQPVGHARLGDPLTATRKTTDERDRQRQPVGHARLGDPLAVARRFTWIVLIVSIASLFLSSHPGAEPDAIGKELLGLLFSIFVLRTLPGRRTNALYLRSFRGDDRTARLRQAIQKGLGRSFRLSGIRAPIRRTSTFWNYAVFFVFCLKYSTTRYMNLEAGDDWFARLWRSLGEARCAFVDLSDLTDHVVREVELVYRSLGPRRVLFLGDRSRTEAEWRALLAERLALRPEETAELRVATWDPGDRRHASMTATVAGFAAGLPPGEAGVSAEAYPLVEASAGRAPGIGSALGHALQAVMGFVSVPLLSLSLGAVVLLSQMDLLLYGLVLLDLVVVFYVLFQLAIYLKDCGSARERSITYVFLAGALAVGLIGVVGPVLARVQILRVSARRAMSVNNLTQIGLALQNYESAVASFPPAYFADRDGRPIHSWRVMILPYIEQRDLYNAYNFGQPWDGPDNRRLAGRMPDIYRVPTDRSDATTTRYLALTGPTAAFNGVNSRSRASVTDRLGATVGIVEVPGDAVPWMKPEDLEADRWVALMKALERREIAAPYATGVNALFLDASVRFLPSSTPERVLRSLTTINGGEVIGDSPY